MIGELSSIAVRPLQQIVDARGELNICTFRDMVPFNVVRIFYVRDVPPGTARGQHGHRRCSQFLICQQGRVAVEVSDGHQSLSLVLSPGQGLLIEPGILATETYLEPGTVLLVLCDRVYEADDYIHDVAELAAFRGALAGAAQ